MVDKKYPHLTLAQPEYNYYKDAKFYSRPRSKEPKQPKVKNAHHAKIIARQKEFTEKKLAEAELGSVVKTGFTDKNREKIKKADIKRTFSEIEQSGSPSPCQPAVHQFIYNNYNFQAQAQDLEPPKEVSALEFFTQKFGHPNKRVKKAASIAVQWVTPQSPPPPRKLFGFKALATKPPQPAKLPISQNLDVSREKKIHFSDKEFLKSLKI